MFNSRFILFSNCSSDTLPPSLVLVGVALLSVVRIEGGADASFIGGSNFNILLITVVNFRVSSLSVAFVALQSHNRVATKGHKVVSYG